MTQSKLPPLEDWSAPWETATGETEIDKGRLKKYLHGLLSDKERLQASVTTVTEERDALQTKIDEAGRAGESDVERLQREKKDLEERLASASTDSIEVLKLRVALEKGLTAVQAKRLVGSTEEELKADADELVASFGGSGKAGEEDDDDKSVPPSRKPRRLSNASDPDPDGDGDVDLETALAKIPRI